MPKITTEPTTGRLIGDFECSINAFGYFTLNVYVEVKENRVLVADFSGIFVDLNNPDLFEICDEECGELKETARQIMEHYKKVGSKVRRKPDKAFLSDSSTIYNADLLATPTAFQASIRNLLKRVSESYGYDTCFAYLGYDEEETDRRLLNFAQTDSFDVWRYDKTFVCESNYYVFAMRI